MIPRAKTLACCLLFTTAAFSQSTIQGSFVHGGISRDYRLYVPAVYNSSVPVPLVLNLHGYTSSNSAQETYGDFRAIADTANFIIAHPNGTLDGTNNRFWNTFNGSTVDDVGFLSALIDTIRAKYSIDQNSIYSTGMSNGGFMSYDLACKLSNRIAAIASVTGSMIPAHKNTCNPSHPMPVMQIHGTADGTVPYAGSASMVPIDSLVKHWVKFNNCSATPVITQVPNVNTSDNCTAERHVYNGGNKGSTVELYKVLGGGHSWPGATFNINVTNMDFSASKEIWRFFRKYKLNVLTTGMMDPVPTAPAWQVYPNPSGDKFIVSFSDYSKKTIRIVNYMGQVIQHFECYGTTTEIYVEKKGLYFIIVTQNNQTRTEKIVKN